MPVIASVHLCCGLKKQQTFILSIIKKTVLTTLGVLFMAVLAFAQDAKETFKPGGSAFMQIYTDFRSTSSNGASASAFEINRAYFGYGYNFSPNFSGKVNLDVGNPGVGGLQMTAYLKNAFLQYKAKGLTADFGLIGTAEFNVQEGFWGNRYVQKTFQDYNGFNPSADLGIGVGYQFAKFIKADLAVYNGEGYKKVQADSTFKTLIGVTLTPAKGFIARGSYDFMTKNNVTQSTVSGFVGYKADKFSLAAEYNSQQNQKNVDSHTVYGPSIWASVTPAKNFKIYARYDDLSSKNDWNKSKDGSLLIAGLEYAPVKGIKLSPNFQGWNPADSSKPNSSSLMLNCEIKF